MKIHEMKCHEVFNLQEATNIYGTDIIRVPGGWIYRTSNAVGVSQCFVPFNDEFSSEGKNENIN